MDLNKLINDKSAFERETLEARMQTFGFKNIERMELFLWDLELFLQIQKRLGDRIALKGGAATQFYLPKDAQRTSVDIDMLFNGTESEINVILQQIHDDLSDNSGLFVFKKHIPKNPKTNLPLHTYYTNVPTVLTGEELRARNDEEGHELKLEFIICPTKPAYEINTGEDIFAVNSTQEYQLLPIDDLFSDKLTTLGPSTIGVQDERLDEQVKQFYDIMMLLRHCWSLMDPAAIWMKYQKRAQDEWFDRNSADVPFSIDAVLDDVMKQLERYGQVDNSEDAELKKAALDFKGLYLKQSIDWAPQDVACGASMIRILFWLLRSGKPLSVIGELLRIEKQLEFDGIVGREKGRIKNEVRDELLERFGDSSSIPAKMLKKKPPRRVFWAVVTTENIGEIGELVDSKG